MGKLLTSSINSTSPKQTEKLANKLGRHLKGGEVIELIGDLGSGKTTFVRGLAGGIGSNDHVASPSFTLSRIYRSGKLTLHHFDFYRLGEAGIMAFELQEILSDKSNICVIEWGDPTSQVLPEQRLKIELKASAKSTSRKIVFHYPASLKSLIETSRS